MYTPADHLPYDLRCLLVRAHFLIAPISTRKPLLKRAARFDIMCVLQTGMSSAFRLLTVRWVSAPTLRHVGRRNNGDARARQCGVAPRSADYAASGRVQPSAGFSAQAAAVLMRMLTGWCVRTLEPDTRRLAHRRVSARTLPSWRCGGKLLLSSFLRAIRCPALISFGSKLPRRA